MIRWRGLVLGGLTFAASHAVETAMWRAWFDPAGSHTAWFLNSGRAVAFTAGCLLVASAAASVAAAWVREESIVQGGNVAAGAAVVMTIVLFTIGPGTVFPIVLAIGAIIASVSGVTGALTGWGLRAAFSRRPRT